MTIAKEHRQYIEKTKCFICNREEAGILFDADFAKDDPDAALEKLKYCFSISELNNIIVTLDKNGAIYAGQDRSFGYCPADKLNVIDSAGAGDAFFAGACAAMICGADLKSACETGNKTASKVLATTENVFMPADDNL